MKKVLLFFLLFLSTNLFGQNNIEWEALPEQSKSKARLFHQSKQGYLIAELPLTKKMMISKDEAKTWQDLPFSESYTYLSFVDDEANGIYFFLNNKIYKIDLVQNQINIYLTLDSLNWVQDFAFKNNKLYIATGNDLRIYNQSDLTLLKIQKWSGHSADLVIGHNNKNYAKTSFGTSAYWYSFDDEGNNFKSYGKIKEVYEDVFVLQSDRLLVLYKGSLHHSDDGGFTWQKNSANIGGAYLYVNAQNEVFIQNYNSFFYSNDEGKTWKINSLPAQFKNNYQGFFYFSNFENAVVYYGYDCDDKNLLISKDKGKIWEKASIMLDKPTAYEIVLTANKDVITRSCNYLNEIKTQDSLVWKKLGIFDTIPIQIVYTFPSGKIMTFNYMNKKYYISIDKGKSWSEYKDLPPNLGQPLIFSVNYIALYINQLGDLFSFYEDKYYMSKDEGKTWTMYNSGFQGSESMYSQNIVTSDNHIYFRGTTNFGHTTNSMNIYNITTKTTKTIDKVSNKLFYEVWEPILLKNDKFCFLGSVLVGGKYTPYLYISPDFGQTLITKPVPKVTTSSEYITLLADSNKNLILLSENNIYISYDEGDTWTSIKNNLPNKRYSSVAISHDNYVYVGTIGGAIYKTKLPIPNSVKTSELTQSPINFSLFPNPTFDEINIKLIDNQSDKSNILIYSIAGKLMQQMEFYGNSTSLNLQQLPDGMYLMELKNGAKTGMKRFIKN